uniref:Ig-like domain-containing protein n=1 Tax=Oryzias latipes TaxID=8090 RepID=A0A3B3HL68_ORYLA
MNPVPLPGTPPETTVAPPLPITLWSANKQIKKSGSSAPTMDLEAQDVVVVEGEKLHLNIPYKAIPTPKMVWLKDSVECKAEERLSMTVEMNSAHLELLKCTRADAGSYTITLENKPPAVEFDDSVKNGLILKAGDLLKLPAVVTGRPQPEVKWTKDESEVDKERMIIETEGKNSLLLIKKVVRADHGKYQITGTNSSGSKTAETRVDVMGESYMTRTRPKCTKESILHMK